MKETIFKVGDRVFDIRFGWGEVIKVDSDYVYVEFDEKDFIIQTYVKSKEKLLSFTEYNLCGFSQTRFENYEEYLDEWGMFYDAEDDEKLLYKFGRLEDIDYSSDYKFKPNNSNSEYYEFFKPLTEEQIKILGLTDKKE